MPMDWEDLVTQIDAQLPKEVWAQTLIGVGVLVLTPCSCSGWWRGWCCWPTACWC